MFYCFANKTSKNFFQLGSQTLKSYLVTRLQNISNWDQTLKTNCRLFQPLQIQRKSMNKAMLWTVKR